MFFTNEINLQNLNTVPEMVSAMRVANIDRHFQVSELMATPAEVISTQELAPFREVNTIVIEDIEVEVISSLRYQRYTNGTAVLQEELITPMNNLVIRRANKRRSVESLRLNIQMLLQNSDYVELQEAHRARVRTAKLEMIANQVLDARASNLIDLEKASEYALHIDYDNLNSPEAKRDFLVANDFTGLDNLGVYNSRPDGYGHTTGTCSEIDFRNRSVRVIGFSSDD